MQTSHQSQTSRVIRFHEVGAPEVLQLDSIEVPVPASGEVLVKVAAIGINRVDTLQRSGASRGVGATLPSGLGMEASGTVEMIGPEVEAFAPGDRVDLLPGMVRLPFGAYAEYLVVPAAALVINPPSFSLQQGAALWVAHLTAYAPLVEIAQVRPGDRVLVNAASSSVGLAAMGITRALGGFPIAITRNRGKVQRLLELGASDVIVSTEEDLAECVKLLTGGEGARVAFDPVAGPGIASLLDAVATDGVLVMYGVLSGQATPLPFSVLQRNLTISGYALDIGRNRERGVRALRFIEQGVAEGTLRTPIARSFPLSEAAEAHSVMETNEEIGKLILLP